MDEYSGRRAPNGLGASKRSSRPFPRDATTSRDQNIQYCNRIGCSGRLNSASAQKVGSDKTKVLRSVSKCSAHGMEVTGSSSKVVPKVMNQLKPLRPVRNNYLSSSDKLEKNSSASGRNTSSVVEEAEENLIPLSQDARREVQLDQEESQSGESTPMEFGSPNAVSTTRPKRTFLKKPSAAVDSSLTSSSSSMASKSAPQLSRQNATTSRPASKNLQSSSFSDVSVSDSSSNNKKPMLKKRSSYGESSSSSRAKQPTIQESARTPSSRTPTSISVTRQARSSQPSLKDNVGALVRDRRPNISMARSAPRRDLLLTDQRLPSLRPAATGNRRGSQISSRPATFEGSQRRALAGPSEVARNLADHEGFRHYNMSGIDEVLLALEGFEQDVELSFEQLLAIESNLFLRDLSYYDQHRDMRLDIDDMSYEELLALEERIGSVSTALPEEALSKCIRRSVYKPISLASNISESDGCEDDTKCTVCQEEYTIGDEMGRLHCEHSYHVDCINQWLRQKNWCPICKSLADSSAS